jgi:hypothetical protein
MSEAVAAGAVDESWPMVEEAVFRLFDELAAKGPAEHFSIGPPLADLGWSDIESEYPVEACELLFRAQGRSRLNSDSLDKVLLAELAPVLDGAVDGIVLPGIAVGYRPGSDAERVNGILLGPMPTGRIAVAVSNPKGEVSVGIVDTNGLEATRLDTFDTSAYWTQVTGPMTGDLVDASAEWASAVAAAHRRRTRQRPHSIRRAHRIVPIATASARRCVGHPGRRPRIARHDVAVRRRTVRAHRQSCCGPRSSRGV